MRLDVLVRFLKMHRLLSRVTGATIADLMEEAQVSRATVYRLLAAVENSGDALEKEELPTRHVRYRLLDPFCKGNNSDHAFRIARDELIAVQFVRRYARMFKGTELEEDVENVFAKIEGSVDPKHYRMLKRLDQLFIPAFKGVKDYTSSKTAGAIDKLANAILLERTCVTKYESFSKKETKALTIDPLHFFDHNGLYLFARVKGHTDIRIFAVERFQSVEMTEERYEYPEGFDPVKRLESTFTIFDYQAPTTFRIRFSENSAKYVKERRWAKGQKIEKQDDGSIILTMTTMGHEDVLRWLLSYGPDAELIEPVDLREELRTSLRRTLEKYGNE
ncbi:MAG TPA: WYL domain-containing transcriptional regulator [Candidatus Deferrimicrobiaceae bacterium]|jgi:proteasome accessory factor B